MSPWGSVTPLACVPVNLGGAGPVPVGDPPPALTAFPPAPWPVGHTPCLRS